MSNLTMTEWKALPEGFATDEQILAIGDIHGRYDLLEGMIGTIESHLCDNKKVIFLGDLIDRGPNSIGTIKRVRQLVEQFPGLVTVLPGNHEMMMATEDDAGLWVYNGGSVVLRELMGSESRLTWITQEELKRHIKESSELQWLASNAMTGPTHVYSGNVLFVHAGVDPYDARERSLARADDYRAGREDWAWSRAGLNDPNARWGAKDEPKIILVHGHTINTKKPYDSIDQLLEKCDLISYNRQVNIDSGSFMNGQLVAIEFDGNSYRFVWYKAS